jgi:hypothetical protein
VIEINNSKQEFSRDDLVIRIRNYEYISDNLRDRLYKLTGCRNFGGCDGMDGSCHYCLEENRELFDKCWDFKYGKVNKE